MIENRRRTKISDKEESEDVKENHPPYTNRDV
jgi:hypothetical protein